jgi:hypothetical protein
VQVTAAEALWHGSFKTTPARVVLVRDPGSAKRYDLGLFTLDDSTDATATAERYSWRWPIEPSNATGKQILGVGDACNRAEKAVERTVPASPTPIKRPGFLDLRHEGAVDVGGVAVAFLLPSDRLGALAATYPVHRATAASVASYGDLVPQAAQSLQKAASGSAAHSMANPLPIHGRQPS